MKSIELYKDAVMRRAEHKRNERRKTQRRLLAACVPLCLCLVIVSVAIFPDWSVVSSDRAPELSNGTACETLEATVSHGTATWTLTDADALYTTLQTLCESVDGLPFLSDEEPESILEDNIGDDLSDVTMGGVPESSPTNAADGTVSENGTIRCYRIRFSNEASFELTGRCLSDLKNGMILLLTEEELSSLLDLLEP